MKGKLFQHFKKLNDAVTKANGKAYLDLGSYCVEVTIDQNVHILYPQFVTFVDGVKRYTPNFDDNVRRFCGWRPYFNKPIPLFTRKLEIKKLMQQNGIPTPEFSTEDGVGPENSIIKRSNSSFGFEIRGPFRTTDGIKLDHEKDEYFEKFTKGKILKTWFWNDKPICAEQQSMAKIKGNGTDTIESLLHKRMRKRKNKLNLEQVSEVLAFNGRQLDTVMAADEVQLVDFRYGSPLIPLRQRNELNFIRKKGENGKIKKLKKQLRPIGELLWSSIPEEVRQNTVYTVDAILDKDNKLWVLETNANPFVHPMVYRFMLKSLAAQKQSASNAMPDQALSLQH